MLGSFFFPDSKFADVQTFTGVADNTGNAWVVWRKRPGATMVSIFALGPGGGGGTGVVGANSTAAGGGGGGSGGQTIVQIPAYLVPDILYISVGTGIISGTAPTTYVSISPDFTANDVLVRATGGTAGTSASGATAGTGGAGGAAATAGQMPLGFGFLTSALVGQTGTTGGTTISAAALTLPVTGLRVTGGTGGGGLPAAAAVGTAGGALTVAGVFPPQSGGIGATGASIPGGGGSNGFAAMPVCPFGFFYGGTGGGSSHGSASGAGLVGGSGGVGGIGSGGGGGGGALTGSTQGKGAVGGPGLVIITAW